MLNGLTLLKSSGICLSFERFLANPEKSLKGEMNYLNVKYVPETTDY